MTEMTECMVNYFSFDGNSEGVPRRYYCYLVVAGPGPTDQAGVATITTLAVHENDSPCEYCQSCFFADTGGPGAAMARAQLYLDAQHEGRRLRKVASQVRRTLCGKSVGRRRDEEGLLDAGEPMSSEQRRIHHDHGQ
jgi:hypothetical protein